MDKLQIEIDIKIPNQTRYLRLIGKIGEELAIGLQEYSGNRNTLAYYINLVITESVINTITHANAGDPDKIVHLSISIEHDDLVIRVYDQGEGFDINNVPPPDFDGLEEGGRGVFLIRSIMDSVNYLHVGSENVLEMRKKLKPKE